MRYNVNIGSQVANCITVLYIKTQVVSHQAKEEAESSTLDRLKTTRVAS